MSEKNEENEKIVGLSVGNELHNRRMKLGIDISQVTAALRIKAVYIDAIEHGDYSALPDKVYAIGFVRSYAVYLGFDADDFVNRFKQEEGVTKRIIVPSFSTDIPDKQTLSHGFLIVSTLTAILLALVWYVYQAGDRRELMARVSDLSAKFMQSVVGKNDNEATVANSQPQPALKEEATALQQTVASSGAAESVDVMLPKAAVSKDLPAPIPMTSLSTIAEANKDLRNLEPAELKTREATTLLSTDGAKTTVVDRIVNPGLGGRIYGAETAEESRVVIFTKGDCWMQIRNDEGKLVFNQLMRNGDIYRVPDKSGWTFTAGNASVVDLMVDGSKAGVVSATSMVRRDITLDYARLKQLKPNDTVPSVN